MASTLAEARLMAAAPDLLAALEAICPKTMGDGWWCPECQDWINLATFHECCPHCGTYLTDVQPSEDWHKQALAAIAKAKGTDHA